MKGYYTDNGYMGYVDGKYMLFADETDYLEWRKKDESSEERVQKKRYKVEL